MPSDEKFLEQAKLLREAYASFPRIKPEIDLPSTWQVFKAYFDFNKSVLPESFDWRDHVTVPPSKFQGYCNSCTSFATAAAIEIATVIARGGVAPNVAAQHMHTCIVHPDMNASEMICNGGIEPRRLLMLLKERGYATSLPDEEPFSPQSCAAIVPTTKLQDFSLIRSAEAKERLTKGPLVTDMYIWGDFFDFKTSKAPMYTPDTNYQPMQIHSVCVVGYTPKGWIIKNSLGNDWGDGTGFGVIALGTCGLLTDSPPAGEPARPAYALEV